MDAHNPSPIHRLEMAHVLFMDIVGYSTLHMDQQHSVLGELQEAVSNTPEFARAQTEDQLIRLPTGDGMALVFFHDPEAPVRCALELSRDLRTHPDIKLRMGIHSGPVYRIADINANRNVAGGGINIAQRVMDCGDAGHILVSGAQAEVLHQLSAWCSMLHDLGEAEVKHGARVHLYNLYTKDAGNPELPKKIRAQRAASSLTASGAKQRKRRLAMAVTIIVTIGSVGGWLSYSSKAHALTERDTIVLADFTNRTGDEVFDDTLKTALNLSLGQSPFLNVLSDSDVARTLQQMTRPASTKLTPEVARELCERAGSKAYLVGSIGSLGSQYVLGLKAVNCRSGDTLVQQQVTAASKERVLDALGKATSKLRGALGESLASVQKLDVPLEQATTSSLEALKEFSLGVKATNEKGPAAALPHQHRAIQLDPNFALSYLEVGWHYFGLDEPERASEYFTKAFQLREHASEREKLEIAADYYSNATGELNKAAQTYQEEIDSYPRAVWARFNLGLVFARLAQYENGAEMTKQAVALAGGEGICTPVSRSIALHCNTSTKRGRSSTRDTRKNWKIWQCTIFFTLLAFSGLTPPRWRSSNGGLRGSPGMKAWGLRSRPTPSLMSVILTRRAN